MTLRHSTLAIVVFTLCIGAVGAAGCNGPQTAPTTAAVSFAGSWQGPLTIPGGSRTLQLEIAQAGENLTGQWTLATTAGADSVTGEITGRVIGPQMALVLTSTASTCPTTVGGTHETGTRLSGTYNTFTAICPSGGTVPIVLDRH
jgi:hypothetical protein